MENKDKELQKELEVKSFGGNGSSDTDQSFKQAMMLSRSLFRRDINTNVGKKSNKRSIVNDTGYLEMQKRQKEFARKSPDEEEQTTNIDRDEVEEISIVQKPSELYESPYNPKDWVYIPEFSSKLYRSIDILKNNIIMNGYELVPYTEYNDEIIRNNKLSDAEKTQFDEEIKVLYPFFEYPNAYGQETIDLMSKVFLDYEYSGTGAIRVKYDIMGNVDSISYYPGYLLRVRRDGLGYVREDYSYGSSFEYFKVLGDTKIMNKNTGLYGSDNENSSDFVEIKDRADSILYFSHFVPGSPTTGMPRYASSKNSAIGNLLSSRLNIDFFVRGLIARIIIAIQNGRLDNKTEKELNEFFDNSKGIDNAKTVLLLQPSKASTFGSDIASDDANKVKIEVTKIMQGQETDATFQQYRKNNDNEQQEIYSLPDMYFGHLKDMNKSTANAARQLTQLQVFSPIAKEFEFPINNKLLPELLKNKISVKIKISNIDDELEKNRSALHLSSNFRIKYDLISRIEYFKCLMKQRGYRYVSVEDSEVPLNKQIVFEKKGVSRFKFIRQPTLDPLETSEMVRNLVSSGSITPNFVIDNFLSKIYRNVDRLDETWANMPMNMTVMLINSKLPPFENPLDERKMQLDERKVDILEANAQANSDNSNSKSDMANIIIKSILSKYGVSSFDELHKKRPDISMDYLFALRDSFNFMDSELEEKSNPDDK